MREEETVKSDEYTNGFQIHQVKSQVPQKYVQMKGRPSGNNNVMMVMVMNTAKLVLFFLRKLENDWLKCQKKATCHNYNRCPKEIAFQEQLRKNNPVQLNESLLRDKFHKCSICATPVTWRTSNYERRVATGWVCASKLLHKDKRLPRSGRHGNRTALKHQVSNHSPVSQHCVKNGVRSRRNPQIIGLWNNFFFSEHCGLLPLWLIIENKAINKRVNYYYSVKMKSTKKKSLTQSQ